MTSQPKGATVSYVYFGIADEFAYGVGKSYAVDVEFIDGGAGTIAVMLIWMWAFPQLRRVDKLNPDAGTAP